MTNPYCDNPFLVLWLPVDATARDIRRRAEDIEATGEGHAARAREAAAILQGPESRLWHSLFWPWPSDGTALDFDIIPDNSREAFYDECRRITGQKTSGDATEGHSRAVAAHALALECENDWCGDMLDTGLLAKAEGFWNQAVESWATLCGDATFWKRVEGIAALQRTPQLTTKTVRDLRPRLEWTLAGIHLSLATDYLRDGWTGAANRHVHHLVRLSGDQNLDDTAQILFSALSTRVDSLVRRYGGEGEKHPESGAALAQKLLLETREIQDICLLLLPGSRSLAAGTLDDIARCANRLCVAFWNASSKSPLPAENCAEIEDAILEWVQDRELRSMVEENAAVFHEHCPRSVPNPEQTQHEPPKVDALHRREFTGRRVEPPEPPPVSREPPKVDALHRREFTGRRVEKKDGPVNTEEQPQQSGTPPGVDAKYRRESFRHGTDENASQSSTTDSLHTSGRAKPDIEEVEAIPVDDDGHSRHRSCGNRAFMKEIPDNKRWLWLAVATAIALFIGFCFFIVRHPIEPKRTEVAPPRIDESTSRVSEGSFLWQSRRQPLPPTGDIRLSTSLAPDSPFEIKAPFGAHCYVKLVHWTGQKEVATIFVREGTTTEVVIPSGTYEVRYASGMTWYGPQYLFGPSTVCAKADRAFTFRPGKGYTLELQKVNGGNLRTNPMPPEEF